MACLITDEEELRMKCGSPGYVAPEILKNKQANTKADIFSLGSFFFNLISGTSLFKGANAKEVLSQNKYSNPGMTLAERLPYTSKECIALMRDMLTIEPEQRPSAELCL